MRLARIEFDNEVEVSRRKRESDLTEKEKEELTPKKKPAKKKKKE